MMFDCPFCLYYTYFTLQNLSLHSKVAILGDKRSRLFRSLLANEHSDVRERNFIRHVHEHDVEYQIMSLESGHASSHALWGSLPIMFPGNGVA